MSKIFPISVTDLNKYQDFLNQQDTPYAKTDEDFLKELREGIKETPIMKAGTLGHELIEKAQDGAELTEHTKDGVTIRFRFPEEADVNIDFLPIREDFIGKIYQIGDALLHLRGKIDGAKPGTIVDYKFGGNFSAEKLASEYQWRAYLSIMGEDYHEVTYSHFTTRENTRTNIKNSFVFDIIEHNEVTFTRDENTERELLKHAMDFYEWSQRAGWEGRKPSPRNYWPKPTVIDPATLDG